MDLLGENFVLLKGKITYKKSQVYDNGSTFFRCKLAVPINDRFQYIKVSVWGELADALSELPNNTWVKIQGHIEESSYDTKCKYCEGPSKAYWTTVVVDNFVVI